MTFSTEQREELERRKALYPNWETEGVPVSRDCPQCSAKYLRVHFKKRSAKLVVTCKQCELSVEA